MNVINIHQNKTRVYTFWKSKKVRLSVRNNVSCCPIETLIGKILMRYFPEKLLSIPFDGVLPLKEGVCIMEECPQVLEYAKKCDIPLVVLLEDIYYGDTLGL